MLTKKSIIIASNRGPVTFSKDTDGEVIAKRGSGGLVTALMGIVQEIDAAWVSCAMTQEDREWDEDMVSLSDYGHEVHLKFVSPTAESFNEYYNVISNPLLWFLQHSMWDLPHAPIINRATWKAWEDGYVSVNRLFAQTIKDQLEVTPKPALVMLQDYQLYLVADFLRRSIAPKERPTILHFIHIPWPGPEYWGILPPTMRQAILEGLLAVDVLGFQTNADALNFLRTCQAFLPRASVKYKPQRVWHRNHATYARNFPISIDVQTLKKYATNMEVTEYHSEISGIVGDNKLVLRIDRIEPSKNIVRGFQAFEELLDLYPEHREKVTFLALLMPSRLNVEEYQDYMDQIMAAVGRVNALYGTQDWEPIRVLVGENYTRAIASLKFYDVLLVNSIADGMNLVAKEGPIVNQRDGVLILSERTGAQEQLQSGALVISPCDVYATAEGIHQSLVMTSKERKERAERLRWLIESDNIHDWLFKQLEAVETLNL